jgi:hypothetical protein
MTDDIKELADKLQALAITLGRMEERQSGEARATALHREEIGSKLDLLATKAEVETIRQDVDDLKDDKKWIVRSVAGAWLAGLGVLWAVVTRKFS